jgi:phenylacetate-CoA ligase
VPSGQDGALGEIVVTSLFRRAVPLLRYRLGDLESSDGANGRSARHDVGVLRQVRGRTSGLVSVGGGVTVHSELFAHVIRDEPTVLRYQLVLEDRRTRLDLVVSAPDTELTRRVAARLRAANARLASVSVSVVDEVSRSVAGKTPLVMDRRSSSCGELR